MVSQKGDVHIAFNRTQYSDLFQRARNAEKLLRDLFTQTGLSGEVRVSLIRQTRGTAHTQGVKLSRYDQSGVLLTVQPGGNDSRIEMSVHPPQGMDVSTFHKQLKGILESDPKGEAEYMVESEAQSGSTPDSSGDVSEISEGQNMIVEGAVGKEANDDPSGYETLSLEEARRRTRGVGAGWGGLRDGGLLGNGGFFVFGRVYPDVVEGVDPVRGRNAGSPCAS